MFFILESASYWLFLFLNIKFKISNYYLLNYLIICTNHAFFNTSKVKINIFEKYKFQNNLVVYELTYTRIYIVRVCQREEINGKSKTLRVCATNSARERKLDCRNMNTKMRSSK